MNLDKDRREEIKGSIVAFVYRGPRISKLNLGHDI